VTLPSRRRLAVRRLAEGRSGRTVVFCHPAPGAGTFDPDPAQTALRNVTLLGVDRPGYGESDPLAPDEWATVDRAARDLADVLDRLGAAAGGPTGPSPCAGATTSPTTSTGSASDPDPQLVQVGAQVLGILVHAERTGRLQLLTAVAA
jgi:hypothetical protein